VEVLSVEIGKGKERKKLKKKRSLGTTGGEESEGCSEVCHLRRGANGASEGTTDLERKTKQSKKKKAKDKVKRLKKRGRKRKTDKAESDTSSSGRKERRKEVRESRDFSGKERGRKSP